MDSKKLSKLSNQALALVILLIILSYIGYRDIFISNGNLTISQFALNISVTIFFVSLFIHSIFKNKKSSLIMIISTIFSILLCLWGFVQMWGFIEHYIFAINRYIPLKGLYISTVIQAASLLIFFSIYLLSQLNLAFVSLPKKIIVLIPIISIIIAFIFTVYGIEFAHDISYKFINETRIAYYSSGVLILVSFFWLLSTEIKPNY